MSGCSTMNIRSAVPHENARNSTITGAYSHPDCGSEANGTPSNCSGFHTGTCPARSAWPK